MNRTRTKTLAPFPRDRAFVVQFRAESAYAGRVEHVDSGKQGRFSCAEDLLAFMTTILGRETGVRKTGRGI